MFYSQFILAKKGPLGTIWIAAHLERKLRKNQVADTDIGFSVDSILFPEMPIALRLSSHLLLGVVRIYSRKVNYLFDDCSEALLKVKQAFRSTAVDLPPEESTAPYHSITLPETFDLDDFELPGTDIFQGNYVDNHISSKEQITLQDTMEGVVYSTSNFGLDERFGDGDACGLDLEEELLAEKDGSAENAIGTSEMAAVNIVDQHVEEYDGDDGPVEYAHAPCTPGLWEEPNLSNVQETSAYDDHQEHENHTLKENLEHASIDQHHNQFEPIENSEHVSHEKSPTEHMLMNDVGLTPNTELNVVDQVRSMSPIAEVNESVDSMVDDPVKMVDLLYKNAMNQVPEVQNVDDNRENYVQHQDISNNITDLVNQENEFHPTNELELNNEPFEDQAFMQPKDSTIPVESTNSFDFMGLRPCVTLSNHDATSLPPSELPHTSNEVLERNMEETYGTSNEVQVASTIPNIQVENVVSFSQEHLDVVPERTPIHQSAYESSISNRQVDSVDEREIQVNNTSNFPAPENMLSFSQDVHNNLVPESTPIIAPGYEGNNMYSGRDMSESLMTTQSITENNTNRYSGRKRSITESSMTSQSLNFNLNESSTFFTTNTNTTKESFRDDDLLSSILVGRNSSILKMKPTPNATTEEPSTKRRRQSATHKTTVTKSGVAKRKVVWDDNMVLHGDTIRQQLTNTEDIRRLRKKAPCTHFEVSLIQKQFWEDELFGQPILTGMSNKLTSLQRELYDISKIAVSLEAATYQKSISHNDDKDVEVQPEMVAEKAVGPDVVEENKEEDNFDPVVVVKDVSEVEPVDVPKEDREVDNFEPVFTKDVSESQPVDNHIHDFDNNNTTNLDYYENQQQMMHTTGDFTELFGPENDILDHATAMEIDENTFQNAADVELLTHADVVETDTNDMSAPPHIEVEETSHNKVVSLLTGPPPGFGFDTYKKMDVQSVVENDSIPSVDNNESMENNVASEVNLDDGEIPEEERRDLVADGFKSDIVVTIDQETEIMNNIEEHEEIVNKDLVSNGEEFPAYDGEGYPVLQDVLLDQREKPPAHPTFNLEDIPDDNDYMYSGVANDTDFLNLDDVDDDDEAADDYMPDGDGEATKMLDNSGWSSRTKAVAKYLQIMFDKEGERGRNMLGVNNLLAGKTRREASRMFFETLVLKSKDYIHVEQADPYENINVFPRAKLLKSEFYKD